MKGSVPGNVVMVLVLMLIGIVVLFFVNPAISVTVAVLMLIGGVLRFVGKLVGKLFSGNKPPTSSTNTSD